MDFEQRKKKKKKKIERAKTQEEIEAIKKEIAKLKEEKEKFENSVNLRKKELKEVVNAGVVVESGRKDDLITTREERKAKLDKILSSEEYEEAFAEDIKNNNFKQTRSLLTDLVSGSVPVPTYLEEKIETNWENDEIFNRVNVTNFKGVAEFPFELSATGATVHTEGSAAPAEEELVLGKVTIVPHTIKKWIKISTEALELKGREFLDYIYDEIEYRIVKKLSDDIVDTIENTPTTATATSTSITEKTIQADPSFSELVAALADISSNATDICFLMNRKTFFTKVANLVDSTGQPIWRQLSEGGKIINTVFGYPVLFTDHLKEQDGTTTHETDIIVGDLKGVTVNMPAARDVKMTTDELSLAELDLVKIVGRLMAGIGVTRDKYFVKLLFRKAL